MQPSSELTAIQTGHTTAAAAPGERRAGKVLAAILLLSVLLRVASAIYQGDVVVSMPGTFDQLSYDALARRVLDGHGFSFADRWWPVTRAGEPTAHWSFLYTGYLVVVYGLFGPHPLVARLIQAVVAGILYPWLTWRLGRRVFGPRAGLWAAGLSAVYAYFFYYAGALMTETFYMAGILWILDAALRLGDALRPDAPARGARPWRLWLELGLAAGVTVLLRQLILFFIPFLLGWLWWSTLRTHTGNRGGALLRRLSAPLPRLIPGSLLTLLVVVALIAPWTARNQRVFDRFVLLNTNAGYAFFWANHPIYGTRFQGILPAGGPSYQELIPTELLPLDEAALDQALLKEGLGFIVDDPVRYLLLSLSRTLEYFKFWPSPDSSPISNLARVGSFGILLPFMLYGLWLSLRTWQRPEQILLYLFMAVYTGIHLASWALIRYRLPVDAVLLLFAGLALMDLTQRLLRNRLPRIQPTSSSRQ